MAFQSKISFVELNKAGTLVVARNTTGTFSASNPGGYGGPNLLIPNIERIIVGLKMWSALDEIIITLPQTPTNMTISQANYISGIPFTLSAMNLLGKTAPLQFDDDLYELRSYTIDKTIFYGDGMAGYNHIMTANANNLYKYDAIITEEDEIYFISKEQQANSNNQVLFLERRVCEEITTFKGVYFASAEFINLTKTSMCLASASFKAETECGCSDSLKSLNENIDFVQRMILGAKMAFERQDYARSSEFILRAQYSCKCNCL